MKNVNKKMGFVLNAKLVNEEINVTIYVQVIACKINAINKMGIVLMVAIIIIIQD